MPLWLERGLFLIAGLWFVNLVNFMDGLDLMTVAEVVPITAALVMLGWLGALPWPASHLRRAMRRAARLRALQPSGGKGLPGRCRQPADRPAARLVPAATCLHHHPRRCCCQLYYLVDATFTLLRRCRREPFWAAHRTHFYQRATDNGFTVTRVVGEVFVLNVVLRAWRSSVAPVHRRSRWLRSRRPRLGRRRADAFARSGVLSRQRESQSLVERHLRLPSWS